MFKIEIKNMDNVLKQIGRYKKDLTRKEQQILERLQLFGATKVSLRFARAVTKYSFDYDVSADIVGNTLIISVQGEQVCFIEFGSGVRFGYGYLGPKPEGIVPIGEYGKGKGKNPKGWWFKDEASGKGVHTYGNPPAMAMYSTMNDLCEYSIDVVREVFK